MNMPELNGIGLINAVCGERKRETANIIPHTGGMRDRKGGLDVGAKGYLMKRLDVCQFRETILKCLSCGLRVLHRAHRARRLDFL